MNILELTSQHKNKLLDICKKNNIKCLQVGTNKK